MVFFLSLHENIHCGEIRKIQEGQDGLYRSPDYQTSLSQLAFPFKRKFNTDFQGGGHLGFPIRRILATFDLQVTSILPKKFESIALFVQEKKIDVQHCCYGDHLGFPIRMILAIFYLQDTPILPIKLRVNGPFGSGEEVKNRFSRWRPSWISDWKDFSYF